jgi:hypothetical protein
MSARKLSRFVGFLFVLAFFLGGIGTASAAVVDHKTGSSTETLAASHASRRLLDTVWS